MVSIVIPSKSFTDLINAGLTIRDFKRKGVESKIHFINEDEIDNFWENLKDYADEDDHSLIIINVPLSSNEILISIDIEPYDFSIVYLPSKYISINPKSKLILLNKGIVSMPQRNPYNCYLGDRTHDSELKWVKINELISLEKSLLYLTKNRKQIIMGFIKMGKENPIEVVENISNNKIDYFRERAKEVNLDYFKHIEQTKPFINLSFSSGSSEDLIPMAMCNYLNTNQVPIGINGEEETVILTNAPSYDNLIIHNLDYCVRDQLRLGKGAIFVLDKSDERENYEENLIFLFGRLSQQKIIIKFDKPKYTIKKTLVRKLIGGPGPDSRSYRGLKDTYRDITFIDTNVVSIPRAAMEIVIDTFLETGSKYEIVI